MRLRNIKDAPTKVMASKYIIIDPGKYIGNFNTLFNNNNPLHLEIGTGKGDFIIGMALNNPNINFIGIEKYNTILLKALTKIEDKNIANLRFISMDASNIDSIFKKEIDILYLNFSDPWPKNRHEGRRLTHFHFLAKYDTIFKDRKVIRLKTDNRKFFEYSIKSLTDYDYKIEELSLNLYDDSIVDNIATEYEKKFRDKGSIYYIKVEK